MGFEQAAIKVEKTQEFASCKPHRASVLAGKAESFLKQMDRKGIRIRDFDAVLAQRVLEGSVTAGLNAQQLYQALTLSDQAQMREFYLSKLEGSTWRCGTSSRSCTSTTEGFSNEA